MAKVEILLPWWLEVGTETCSACHHLYPYGTEHRCSHCDGPVCSSCAGGKKYTCRHCSDDEEGSIDIDIEI